MPSTSFAGGALRVTTPPSYSASRVGADADRALPGEPGSEVATGRSVLLEALADVDLEVVDRVELAPRVTRDLDAAPPANRRGHVRLDVDVAAGEDAVVLVERDGVYSWHLPANPVDRTRDLEPGPRTAHFEIDVQPARPSRRPAGERAKAQVRARVRGLEVEAGAPRTRGLLGDLVHGTAQAIVFRFAASALLKSATQAMEAHVRPGLVRITGSDVTAWTPFERLDELDLPTDRAVRLLLFVHGTFSSTVGAFAPLALVPGAEGFVETLVSAYDAVIGFDHKTLTLDPKANAEDLLQRLASHHPRSDLVIDIITHSRGGLVTRAFAEDVLPSSSWPGTVDRIVFVAATNGGTHLADPKRWSDLVDVYTNLAAVGAGVLSLLPGGAPVGAVVGATVKGIGAFVKYLVSYAAKSDDVPGLQAMMPDGAFVAWINADQPGQPKPGTDWFVVSSDFHVELFDDHHSPQEFPRELVAQLAEGFMDQIFEDANDLVVDTASMAAIGLPAGGFVKDSLALGANEVVYHTNYFGQLKVIEAIAGWLPLGMGAGGGESAERDLEMAEPPAAPDELTEGPDELIEAQLGAEMPAAVVSGEDFTLRVRLARTALTPSVGTSHAEQEVHLDAERPVTVQVFGKANATVADPDTKVFGLPSGDWTSELSFTVRAIAAGPVTLLVVVRQGAVPIANLSLEGTALEPDATAFLGPGGIVKAVVHTGIDAPELDGLACLDIVECRLPGGERVYHYAVRLVRGEPAETFTSAPVLDRDGFVRDRVAAVEATLRDEGMGEGERLSALQDIGTQLFDQFFPEPMQAYLWAHRDKVADLIVYTDEPYVPWELVHLKQPRGKRGTKPRFLAQGGLVRWQLGSFPPRRVRVRTGRVRSICPVYADPMFDNREGVAEQEFLVARLGAKPVTATPRGVEQLLRSGRFDVLHFSGHGAARSDDIADAKVLLKGRKRGRTVEPQYLSATAVSENVDWTDSRDGGPLVVLNACQTGRSGELCTTVGGFAKAFLDAGAAAFVSCLWSVREQPARVFVETLYEELLAGRTMAAASTSARRAAREAGDPTWLAFVVYARPDAVLVRT
ncbi:hypothetical protein N865_14760 [Intrasporangium oryzae NRRL B-24470]|uniref:Uncharacterized protein n=1 Tax=Intrasporangium oryzae NRRL B-24470 TaxID=1386089 RepID=W9G367_9MICO|nr:CHAT domain-containing protein [Intrasporangium oryzae]EWT00531.1 hypothetical protein N865_14760 [Intrasporangium oryzae NRRL B-24470]